MQQAHLSLCPVCPECPENCPGNTVEWRGKVIPKFDGHLEPAPWHIQAIGELRQSLPVLQIVFVGGALDYIVLMAPFRATAHVGAAEKIHRLPTSSASRRGMGMGRRVGRRGAQSTGMPTRSLWASVHRAAAQTSAAAPSHRPKISAIVLGGSAPPLAPSEQRWILGSAFGLGWRLALDWLSGT